MRSISHWGLFPAYYDGEDISFTEFTWYLTNWHGKEDADEIGRLNVELSEENDRLIAEIERLENELKKAHHLIGQSIQWQHDAEIVKVKQQIEIERLRAKPSEMEGE